MTPISRTTIGVLKLALAQFAGGAQFTSGICAAVEGRRGRVESGWRAAGDA